MECLLTGNTSRRPKGSTRSLWSILRISYQGSVTFWM
jgi:hypothetical protein